MCGGAFQEPAVDRWTDFELRQCTACGLQLWDPPVPADSAWYDTSDHYLAAPLVDWLGWYHRWALDRLPDGARSLLDIGCADGRFVHAAASQGVDARGVDHSARLVEIGNLRYGGDRLSRTAIEELKADGRVFDVVTMFEVIEHVIDPVSLLRTATSVLAPGGTIIVSTPNRLGRPHPPAELDRPPHHLTRWTPETLRVALAKAGLNTVQLGLSPGHVGLTGALLGKVRLGLVVGLLRRRASMAPRASSSVARRDVRSLILAKERAFRLLAYALLPIAGWAFRGGSMVAIARR